ncbi:hypothetical protein [Alishewanella sp. HL-SH05]
MLKRLAALVALSKAILGLHRFATCLRQSKFVPDEFVAMRFGT